MDPRFTPPLLLHFRHVLLGFRNQIHFRGMVEAIQDLGVDTIQFFLQQQTQKIQPMSSVCSIVLFSKILSHKAFLESISEYQITLIQRRELHPHR